MLSDVYRSRFGLLPTPAVPAVVVRGRTGGTGPGSVPADRIAEVVADTLGGAPVPVVADGRSVVVLLPLVEPAEAATVFSALRAEFDSLELTRRAMTLEALAGLGSLAGRLRAASEGPGMA